MKKIGIITFHNAHNYGAILQTYALQKVLKAETFIIDYRNNQVDNQYKVIRPLTRNIKKTIRQLLSDLYHVKARYLKNRNFKRFIKVNLKLSRKYKSIESLKKNPPKADIYITGSDQVWNTSIVGELSDAYTLNFGSSQTKKISYAASIGHKEIDKQYIEEYKTKISKLNAISVREEDAKVALNKIIDNNIDVVLDPTLLIKKEEWIKEIENYSIKQEKYILTYVVEDNEEQTKIVDYLSDITGYRIIEFSLRNHHKNIIGNAYVEGPLEFINLIKNAEYIVTTSFHATAFSILFEKKFFVVPHIETGSRVTNLLEKLGIENRKFYNLEEFKKIDFEKEINYMDINKRLEKLREESFTFLKNAIGN